MIAAFYGVLFEKNEEAAYSNYRLWESAGFIVAFAYNTFICMTVKLSVLAAVLTAGMAGYLAVEASRYYSQRRRRSVPRLPWQQEILGT